MTVGRTSIDRFAYQTVFPYLSIYIVALGATGTQLGFVNTIGMAVAGFFGPFTGWFIDRVGCRRVYLFGIGIVAVAYLTYALAQSWTVAILGMAAYWLGFSLSIHSCATVCGNCLPNQDRATGMMFCETVAAGLLGMAGPALGAWMVASFGGVNADGIRPLFFFALALTVGTFFFVFSQLSDIRWCGAGQSGSNLVRDLYVILKEGRHLKKWLVIIAVGQLPMGMVLPFSQVFAYEMKGADAFVLAAMVTGAALASIAFAIPLGRLADRVGRKKVLFILIPLFWASNIMLVLAPSPLFVVLAGAFQGFYFIAGPLTAAMERELVPAEQMARWLGIVRFFRMIPVALLALVAGALWDRVGPQYVFLTFVALDLVIRVPLLVIMPETLRMRPGAVPAASTGGGAS